MKERYFVKAGDAPEREVTMQEWVAIERRAGFHNTLGHPELPATGGFSSYRPRTGEKVEGRIEYVR